MHSPSAAAVRSLRERSQLVIREHQHASGAYPASPTFSVYGYSWLRDGSFVADAMSRIGDSESALAFFHWCRRVLESKADHVDDLVRGHRAGEQVEGGDMLPTRYTLDGTDGTASWWDFQLDGYGTWLWALQTHLARHNLDPAPFRAAVEVTVRYLGAFGDLPCYDWWEESHEKQHLSTLGAVLAGLRAARRLGLGAASNLELDSAEVRIEALFRSGVAPAGHLGKWVGSTVVDGSLLSCFVPFDVCAVGSPVAEATYRRVLDDLTVGGVYRYRGDTFYGGGEWLNLTAWLGWYEAVTGRVESAKQRRAWIAGQATQTGLLPEQVSGNVQAPDRVAEWVQRWGPVATPLLWSHAMYLTLDTVIEQAGAES